MIDAPRGGGGRGCGRQEAVKGFVEDEQVTRTATLFSV